MVPPESPIHDPLEGELTEPPPSDLSDYTWDDSETERREPGQLEGNESASAGAGKQTNASASEETRQFVDLLVQSQLVGESEIRAVCTLLSAGGHRDSVQRLSDELVRRGKLTRYQAAAIRQGKTKGLAIGNYIVLDKIGSGGMGLVLKARHRQLQRIVALKLLPPSVSRDRSAVIRFRREAAAVAKLRHPNIVSALDAGETHGLLFLVMEYVDGKDLARIVREKGPLSVIQAADCVIQAARGLGQAHAHGIVHRDIKPANLLLDSSGTVKVLDLGLARVSQGQDLLTSESSELNLTVSGAIVGTVDYMSPEQAYNPRLADDRSDIYSLGCTLHYLLTGKPPFGGQGFMERLIGHRERPIPSLRRVRTDVPQNLDTVFRRLMSKSPETRPQSMSEVIKELEEGRHASSRQAPNQPILPGNNDDPEEDPKSVYGVGGSESSAELPATSSSQSVTSVFVRSRGASSDWIEGPRPGRLRSRRRLIGWFLILATGALLGWYFVSG